MLSITLGPVQDFIAQARRTRDLWYGSELLSQLSRKAAAALVERGACLIFPDLSQGGIGLAAGSSSRGEDGQLASSIANKLLAEVPEGIDPARVAREVREAVMGFWRDGLAAKVKVKCADLLAEGIDAVWDEQVATFVEFAAAWAPLGSYREARQQVERALSSRKNLRDFAVWTAQSRAVPKSSLDGGRETVLRPGSQRDKGLSGKYRIAVGEQLDAVGLVKRAGGEPDQFVPVINVAVASWVDLAAREAPGEINKLRAECKRIELSRIARPDLPCAQTFPFDASVLLPSRWGPVFTEQGLAGSPGSWGDEYVRPLLRKIGEPYPYVACLAADGDRLGQAISLLESAQAHRSLSLALASFAERARSIIEQDHHGALIYAGGDDVLAFLPLPEALECADDLRRSFAERVGAACAPAAPRASLSVGLGVGHVMEGMGDLLALGREAEREAKLDRDALAVVVEMRSGGRRSWRARWTEDPARLLRADMALLDGRLSSRKVHEISRTLARLPAPASASGEAWARLLALEVRRSLARVGDGSLSPGEAGLPLDDSGGYPALHACVRSWVARLLIARTFNAAAPGRRGAGEVVA
ncbi:MAG TPA: type III-B CRISPR-associated protein Cas10/Cmr2 [Terriglobales bacterium]|nr:type III-B CRISPR-associated protein Cas10/Cmr2 [Terriglobales bacterium]